MVKVLVSIATAPEAPAAIAGGAEILDVKDPARGSLGPADVAVVRAARRAAPARVVVSAALGDRLLDLEGCPSGVAELARRLAAAGATLLKVGLAGAGGAEAARGLARLRAALDGTPPPRARLVAVAFADAGAAGGVPPGELPGVAARAGVWGAMLDTLAKGPSILDVLGDAALVGWVAAVRARGLACGLAGSLSLADLARAAALQPDVVGLRGAICVGGRGGRVEADLVRRAVREVRLAARRGAACA